MEPTARFTLPDVVGRCSNLLIDLSASSGSGGFPWRESHFEVKSSVDDNTTDVIQDFLNSDSQYTG
jgi:hypothetical protein